jgi:GNAT superfamily N-acetyltransferase
MSMSEQKRETRNYDIRLLETSPEALQEVLDLFIRGGSGMSNSIEFLDWQYNQNPRGRAVGFNAYYEGSLAAHYAAIPVVAHLYGQNVPGILSINTRTDAAHQGQGLFTKLARATYDHARSVGYAFVVGVANDNSVHGFTKKLGFQHVGMMQTYFVTNPSSSPQPSLDYATAWDAESLRWRLSNPTKRYSVRRSGDRALLFSRSSRFRVLIADVEAAIVPPDLERAAGSVNPFSMWLGVTPATLVGHPLRVPVPARLRETSLNLIFLDLTGHRTLDADQVKFWAIDFDAY